MKSKIWVDEIKLKCTCTSTTCNIMAIWQVQWNLANQETSIFRTPPYSGHLHIQNTYCGPKCCICMLHVTNPRNQDTSIKWTLEMVPRMSGLERFHCIHLLMSGTHLVVVDVWRRQASVWCSRGRSWWSGVAALVKSLWQTVNREETDKEEEMGVVILLFCWSNAA